MDKVFRHNVRVRTNSCAVQNMEKEGEGPAEAGGEADNAEYTQLYGEQPDKT